MSAVLPRVLNVGESLYGDVVVRLSSLAAVRRSWRRAALRYAAKVLREELGYPGAADALETEVDRRFSEASS